MRNIRKNCFTGAQFRHGKREPVSVILNGAEIDGCLFIRDLFHHRSRGNNTDHITLNDAFGLFRVFHLFNDGNLISAHDKALHIGLHRMVRHAAHRDAFFDTGALSGQHKIKFPACGFRVVKKHFIKIPDTIKHQRVRILFLDAEILLDHRGIRRFFRHFLLFSECLDIIAEYALIYDWITRYVKKGSEL